MTNSSSSLEQPLNLMIRKAKYRLRRLSYKARRWWRTLRAVPVPQYQLSALRNESELLTAHSPDTVYRLRHYVKTQIDAGLARDRWSKHGSGLKRSACSVTAGPPLIS